jgi:hypothetical protein
MGKFGGDFTLVVAKVHPLMALMEGNNFLKWKCLNATQTVV